MTSRLTVVCVALMVFCSVSFCEGGNYGIGKRWGRRSSRSWSSYGSSSEELNQVVNGKWNYWTSWSTCSKTCNTGLSSRRRYCTYPKPGPHRDYVYCHGDPVQYRTCVTTKCPTATVSAFSAYLDPSLENETFQEFANGSTVVFNMETLDADNSYDDASGVFTAKTSGTYFFTWTVVIRDDGDNFFTVLMKNSMPISSSKFDNPGNEAQVTNSVIVALDVGDMVFVKKADDSDDSESVDGIVSTFEGGSSAFSGFRLSE